MRWLAALAAIMLGACTSSAPPKVEENAYPANYRAEIIRILRATLTDPSNTRDAFVSEPALRPSGNVERYIVCMRFNAKNALGQYTGSQERIAFFFAAQVTQIVPASGEQCAGVTYAPFPELEKYCLSKNCNIPG